MTVREHLESKGPKKLLALDGGGIRGAMTIEVLAGLESMLRKETKNEKLLLGDYFDYIAGTSTGAILAAALAKGLDVATLREFYRNSGAAMFEKASVLKRFRYKYEDESLAGQLKQVFGSMSTLCDDSIRTLLMMVMRNATTDSPWPVSNNPAAKYNARTHPGCNLDLPLWQLVRASTAAPTYFPPERVLVGEHEFMFVDGGVTMYNNPAFQLFLMATLAPYRLEWPTGEERMLLVSIGTGFAPEANRDLQAGDMNLLYNAGSVPSALMAAALHEQDTLCRTFGRCLVGEPIDRELGDLKTAAAPGGVKLFSYLRYNAELSASGLAALGISDIEPARVQTLDAVSAIDDLQRIGRALAQQIDPKHFAKFV